MINWEQDNRSKYSSGLIGKSGKYIIFCVMWDALRSKDSDTPPHKLICNLPGLKKDLGNFESTEEAKNKAMSIFEYWIERAEIK